MMRINFDTLRRAWKQSFTRKMALASGVVVVGAAGLAAMESRSGLPYAPPPAACCTSAVSTGESAISPAIGADKDFFEVPSSPPSVFFLLGNNRSMQEYATDPATIGYMPKGYLPEDVSPTATPTSWWYTDTYVGNFNNSGCSDTELVKKMAWFDKTSSDPAKNGSIPYDADTNLSSNASNATGGTTTTAGNAFFDPNLFYHVKGWRVAWSYANEDYPYSVNSTFDTTVGHADISYACKRLWNNNGDYAKTGSPAASAYAECVSCLTTKGWWRGPMGDGAKNGAQGPAQYQDEPPFPAEARRKWIVSGRVLNLHPPKFAVARKVLKDVIASAPNVRMGAATFGDNHGWYDPPLVLRDIQPGCSVSYPTIDEAGLDRAGLMKAVNNAVFRNPERSIGEALLGLGAYFSSQGVDGRWKTWFAQPIGTPEFGWPGQPNGGTYDDTYPPKYTGAGYGATNDEWLKGGYTDPSTGIYGPPLRFEQGGDLKSVCFSCQVSSTIVITDGTPRYDNTVPITKMMSLLIAAGARHELPGKPLVTFDSTSPKTNLNSGGINYCDQFGVTKEACDYADADYNWPTGLAKGNRNFMDDVSFFLAHIDLRGDLPGMQTMRTYTVGYGDNSPMLQSIAKAGKGKFYRADNPAGLRAAILDALGDIKQQSTSFASSNIAGVQTGTQSSTFVPRFVPRRGRPYEGHLYRFFYFNEFAQGCQPVTSGFHPADLNKDGDCDDSFYLDKPASFTSGVPNIADFTRDNIVQENDQGNWVKLYSGTVTNGVLTGGADAQPFWDVVDTLNQRRSGPVVTNVLDKDGKPTGATQETGPDCDFDNPLNPSAGRCIFTMIDRNADGKFTADDNPPVEFSTKNVALLKDYLLAGGDSFCTSIMARSATGSYTGSVADQETCARVIIQFIRGKDVFDYDGDNIRSEARPCADDITETPSGDASSADPEVQQHRAGQKTCKLADIFHSTPVVVEPPVDPFVCSLGLSSQCLSTIYDDFSYTVTSEPLCGSGGTKPCYKPTPMEPERSSSKRNGVYDDVYTDAKLSKRYRVLLVGSNGGMLHAIHVGTANQTKTNKLDSIYDMGTGQELWAFVPPDLMPKLNLTVLGHEYLVDGTSMVRDIWADGSGGAARDGKKQKSEFRTIAITGERSGGQRYTALDMTDPLDMLNSVKAGTVGSGPFRWMFPNACDKESVSMGESWSNFAPKPPPIGPVRIKASNASSPTDIDRGWEERWVAILSGGYSPDLSRGRGMYMLDAWSGTKLWVAEAHPGSGASGDQGVLNAMQPMAASAALVDIGKSQGLRGDLDGFFDTMLVGDMGGQMWTFRFRQPGELDGNGLVKNWFGARSLEVARTDDSTNASDKSPFFQVASSVVQPETGWLRSFIGTGDRQHLRTTPGTDCSADDLLACIRLKCDVKASFLGEVNGQQRTSTIEYKGGVLTNNVENVAALSGGSFCSSTKLDLTELTYSCPAAAYGSAVYPSGTPPTYKSEAHCAFTSGQWVCTDRKVLNTVEHHDQVLTADEKTTVGTNRFFGFHSYGGPRVFETEAEAVAFDAMRVTDRQTGSCAAGVKCALVDVTIPDAYYSTMVDSNGTTQRYISQANLNKMRQAGSQDPGWFLRYTNTSAERTATGSTVLAGVVFWSSFSPSTTAGADVCSLATMNDSSYSWQADAISGMPDQAAGFQLANNGGYLASRMRKTAAPPGEPTPVVSMSSTGGIRYEVAVSSAGTAPTSEKLSTRKNTTPDISWMEVPRNLHDCRHENSDACADSTPP